MPIGSLLKVLLPPTAASAAAQAHAAQGNGAGNATTPAAAAPPQPDNGVVFDISDAGARAASSGASGASDRSPPARVAAGPLADEAAASKSAAYSAETAPFNESEEAQARARTTRVLTRERLLSLVDSLRVPSTAESPASAEKTAETARPAAKLDAYM